MNDTPRLDAACFLITHPKSKYEIGDVKKFSKIFETDLNIISRNSFNNLDVCTLDLFMERIQSIKTYNDWTKYAGHSKLCLTFSEVVGLSKSWIKIFHPKFRLKRKISIARIFNINSSHIVALNEFLNSGMTYGVVLEDDVQFPNIDLAQKEIGSLIEFISKSVNNNRPLYVEMSDSFSFEQMKATNLINLDPENIKASLSANNKVYETRKPFPNTTCSYLLNSEMAKSLLEDLKKTWRGKRYRTLPIDWMYLRHFMNSHDKKITNLHVVPGIFKQGSIYATAKE